MLICDFKLSGLSDFVGCESFLQIGLNFSVIAFLGHLAAQLKQSTHFEKSTYFSFTSIHSALQFFSHILQLIHFEVSKEILKIENLAKILRNAPTGQSVLQKILPLKIDAIDMAIKMANENPNAANAIAGVPSKGGTVYMPIPYKPSLTAPTEYANIGWTTSPILFPYNEYGSIKPRSAV